MKKRLLSLLMAVCMVVPLLAAPAAAAPAVATFSDISDRETSVAVESLRLLGVLDGFGNNTFRPEGQLTRAQFCKMAVYAMNGSGELGRYRTVTVFPDVKPSHWAAAYINMAAKGKQIIAGFPDGRFHPNNTVSVGQAVTILMRLLGYKDEDVGGVWPHGHMASASTIGLLNGVETDPYATLTRGTAARLFLNLLRSEKKDGSKYSTGIATTVVSDVMLLSSSAVANGGSNTAMQLSTGAPYQIADGKASNGMLNGFKGTLLLNKQGQVLTFVPDSVGNSKVVTVASATATQLTDTSGAKYSMQGTVKTHTNGAEKPWSEAYAWMTPGKSVTLYIGVSGSVEYVFEGGGSTANAAVIVYSNGSSAGFDSLTGGTSGYSIYKNGASAGVGDMRKYDVATYSAATNTIRVCDTRITGIYENCTPTPNAPEKITVMKHEFNVLPSAVDAISKFKVGSQITLLLTEDNQVAGAVEGGSGGVMGNAIGIVKSITASTATVNLLCGIEVSGDVTLSSDNVAQFAGQLVRVSSGKAGTISLGRLSGGVSGNLDVAARKLGNKALADNAVIFEKGSNGLTAISLSQLTVGTVPENQISYAATDWAGQISLIVLGSTTGGRALYGRVIYTPGTGGTTPTNPTIAIEYGNATQSTALDAGYAVQNGDYVVAILNSRGDGYASMTPLTKLGNVPNSAWSGAGAVSTGGRTYTVSSSVVCYNKAAKSWVTLSAAHAFSQICDLYVDDSGVVRVLEVGQ